MGVNELAEAATVGFGGAGGFGKSSDGRAAADLEEAVGASACNDFATASFIAAFAAAEGCVGAGCRTGGVTGFLTTAFVVVGVDVGTAGGVFGGLISGCFIAAGGLAGASDVRR